MNQKARFKGDVQVDGRILNKHGDPIGGPPAKLTAEANPTSLFCSDGDATDITDWEVDLADGVGMGLNDDGIHFDLTAGIYIANAYMDVRPVPVGTLIRVDTTGVGAYRDAGPNFSTVYRGSGGDGGSMGWFTMDEDGQMKLHVSLFAANGTPLSGTDATSAQIRYVGFDLLKLA